jgi:hypothetical protein
MVCAEDMVHITVLNCITVIKHCPRWWQMSIANPAGPGGMWGEERSEYGYEYEDCQHN